LTSTTSEQLLAAGISLDIPFGNISEVKRWFFWRPPWKELAWIHHLHINDEVYQYNLNNDWTFPGFEIDGNIIFAAKELEHGSDSEYNKMSLLDNMDRILTHWVVPTILGMGYSHN
jgi:hypothetical protein